MTALHGWPSISGMAATTMKVLLTPELKDAIARRVRSGLYSNASDVIRAGLRALLREEAMDNLKEFERIMAELPQDPITPEIEQSIVRGVKESRERERKAKHCLGRPGSRPRKTRADLEREARKISPRNKPKVNFTAAIRDLRTK